MPQSDGFSNCEVPVKQRDEKKGEREWGERKREGEGPKLELRDDGTYRGSEA